MTNELLLGRQRVMWNLLNDALQVLRTVECESSEENVTLSDLRIRIIDTLNVVQLESLRS